MEVVSDILGNKSCAWAKPGPSNAQATATKAMRMARNCGGVFIFRQRQIGDGCAPYHGGNPGFRRSHRFSPYIKQFSGTFLGLAPLGIGKSPEIGMAP